MGWRERLRFVLRAARSAETFTGPIQPVDQLIVANKRVGWTQTVSRETALQVPAVLRGRNLICSIATLPLRQYGPDRRAARAALLDQIDPQVPNVVTLSQTVEDLLFDAISWWRVTARGWNEFPSSAQHVDVTRVHLNPPPGAQSLNLLPSGEDPSAAVWIDTEVVPGRDMIRFDSPNPAMLMAARRAIRRAVKLELAAERYADDPKALEFFTPTEGADPVGDDAIEEILDDWMASRRERAVAYVPAALEHHTLDWMSPADLQLVGLQQRAALDLANALGVDPEDLGISTTSRTYQNATDRRQDTINQTLSPFMRAITDRLSMNDITRRGYYVAFDLDNYMRADPTTRAGVASTLHGIGALTVDEIREVEGRPVLTPAQRAELKPKPAPAPAPAKGTPVTNSAPIATAFEDAVKVGEYFTFDSPPGHFAVDATRRTITGEILPYGKIGQNYAGRWLFEPGSISWNASAVSRVKLNVEHYGSPFGAATKLSSTASAVEGTFKVGRGAVGDEQLMSAEDGIRDGLSAEVRIEEYTIDRTGDAPVNRVTSAVLTGVALTAKPAFDDARVTKVAASQTGGTMPCSTCGQNHAPGTPCAPAPTPVPAPAAFTAESLTAAIQAAVIAAFEQGQGPIPVNPRRSGVLVNEPLPYRFRGARGEHDFSTDVFAMARNDSEATTRVTKFLEAAFADVSTGDVNELNPTRNRPDLWVDNLDFTTPIWDAINKGTIADSTPFTLPKFNSAADLVAAHTESTEPTGGTYTTTGQTITPAPVSGKVEITRETIDQGGNPQVSTIIWNEIVRAYNEALEVAAVALLDSLTPTGITLNGIDSDLDADLTANLAALQFIRGGNRFRDLFIASDLFTALTGATDDIGRKLFPIISPSNADGTTSPEFGWVTVGSLRARPAWALEAGNGGDGSSYLFNRGDVHGWASAPRKLNFEYEVKSVWLGVWGYVATANTRAAGVREITYSAV